MNNTQLDHQQHQRTGDTFPVCLLAHNIDLAANVGGLFRIADALGVEKIYLTGTSPTPPNPKIRKTSRSTDKYVPYSFVADPLTVVSDLRASGYEILSLEVTSGSVPLEELALEGANKVCLILGAENEGVPQALLDASDQTVHIPMLGVNSSMNVAVACSIAAYAIISRLNR